MYPCVRKSIRMRYNTNMGGVFEYLASVIVFINNVIIPFLVALAIIFFIINVFRFFILGGASDTERGKGKRLVIHGTLALVFVLVFWGIVALLVGTLDLGGVERPCPDIFGQD